ncbi:Hypothetical protein A7982_05169 [Minicystis rosea]|nr:Hypothetical protein A7982_05169 [Minicystis rosea]
MAKLLAGVPRADYELELGDILLFDPCNYHQVRGSRGVRMTSHGNLAVDPDTREFAFYT